ncbi:MAG: helix-turn-helix domain-containing protein [Nitriliruptoraceae bacterium]
MTDDAATGIGATLRQARESQGLSREDVAGALRARVAQVQALEDEDFELFGGDVYAKGFVKIYAIELGLDPQPLLETYREQFASDDAQPSALMSDASAAPRPPRASPPAWLVWVLAAVVIVAGVVFLSQLGAGNRSPETASPDDDVEESPPTSVDEGDDPDATDGEDDEDEATDDRDDDDGSEDEDGEDGEDGDEADDGGDDDEDADQADPDSVELVLAFEEDSWMRIEVDGTIVLEEVVSSGETLPFEGDQEIEVRIGNAGGVIAELNGEDLGSQGDRGEVVDVRFTPDGAERV